MKLTELVILTAICLFALLVSIDGKRDGPGVWERRRGGRDRHRGRGHTTERTPGTESESDEAGTTRMPDPVTLEGKVGVLWNVYKNYEQKGAFNMAKMKAMLSGKGKGGTCGTQDIHLHVHGDNGDEGHDHDHDHHDDDVHDHDDDHDHDDHHNHDHDHDDHDHDHDHDDHDHDHDHDHHDEGSEDVEEKEENMSGEKKMRKGHEGHSNHAHIHVHVDVQASSEMKRQMKKMMMMGHHGDDSESEQSENTNHGVCFVLPNANTNSRVRGIIKLRQQWGNPMMDVKIKMTGFDTAMWLDDADKEKTIGVMEYGMLGLGECEELGEQVDVHAHGHKYHTFSKSRGAAHTHEHDDDDSYPGMIGRIQVHESGNVVHNFTTKETTLYGRLSAFGRSLVIKDSMGSRRACCVVFRASADTWEADLTDGRKAEPNWLWSTTTASP